MTWVRLNSWAVPLACLLVAAASVVGPLCPHALAQQSGQSWSDSITSPFKQGFDKLGRAINPKSSATTLGPEDDAISLKTNAKPGAVLYVALAHFYEQSGKTAEAEENYQLALQDKDKPDNIQALLGYAHLKESLGKSTEAIQLYQRAATAYPHQASVHNNLALCYARQDRLDEAVAAMSYAVQLESKNPLYRNNMATLLVDQGKLNEALAQLRQVHGDAAAYYNMGYLLNKKGQTQAAIRHFGIALKIDPSMDAARRWVAFLQRETTQSRLPQHPAASGVRITNQVPMQPVYTPVASDESAPQRLPPTRQTTSDAPSLPGISYDGPIAPAAPFPPPSTNTALRPLPRVN